MAEPEVSPIVVSVLANKGKGLEYRNPKLAVQVLEMVCNGSSYRQVELATGVTFDQLMFLRGRHAMAIEKRRQQLALDGFELAEGVRMLAKEKIVKLADNPKQLANTSLRDLAVSYGIFHDKGLLAAEGNRTIVEHKPKLLTLEDAAAAIDEARKFFQKEAIPVEAKVIPVGVTET